MKQPLKQPRQEPEEAATLLSAKADAAVSPAKAARDAAWDRCVALWRNVSKGAGKLTRSRGLGRDLVAAIRRDGPDVTVLRFRWVVESDHHRAVFLRERGEMKTLLRLGNVGQYDLWAAEWAEGGYRSQATPSPKRAKSAPMSFREAYALHGMYGDRRHERDDDPNTITVLPE